MSATPFIRTVRTSGGTLYIFQSASEDLNFLMNEADDRAFTWSKFVLLDLPEERRPTAKRENYIQYDAIPGSFDDTTSKTAEFRLAESFQNYCLNFETVLLNDVGYEPSLKRTVSERVFFKWLKEIGALRFRQADDREKSANVDGARFVEEVYTQDSNYNRVVQYIGDIDMVNSNKFKYNSFSEIYIHVPISHGNTKNPLFNVIEDENYKQNKAYRVESDNSLNDVYLFGRTPSDNHPMGLSTLAYYDSPFATFETNTYSLRKEVIENETKKFISGWSYENPINNSYRTSSYFADQHTDKLKIVGKNQFLGRDINVLKSRLDGITLDFDTNSYYDIVTNPSVNSFGEYNQLPSSSAFEFNAVALYYDVYEKSNPEETKVSNLFGVLFLNKPEDLSAGGSRISTLQKFKPNTITGDNGNAWGLKVNLKLDVSASDTQIETVVNEYNTYSMELFLEAMSELKRTGDSLDNQNEQFIKVTDKLLEIEDYVYRQQDVSGLLTKYQELQDTINAANEVFTSNNELVALIQRAFTEINNIYENKTSIEVAYNLDVINDGFGIKIDNVNNKKKINLNIQEYTLRDKTIYSVVNDFGIINNQHTVSIPNYRYTQLMRVQEDLYTAFDTKFLIDKDVVIRIDDTNQQWIKGKKLRISFGTNYASNNNFNVVVKTDAIDRRATGSNYGIQICNFSNSIFKFKRIQDGTAIEKWIPPIIEITCIDDETLKFIAEIL